MATYKTPGVYIEEKDAFPNSVVAVETAVPAFFGYTETASKLGKNVTNQAIKVTSMVEFEQFFGGPPTYHFKIENVNEPDETADPPVLANKDFFSTKSGDKRIDWDASSKFRLYNCVKHFYQNGGGNCWIVSVGDFSAVPDKDQLLGALPKLADEPEPTMLLCPDALALDGTATFDVYTEILTQCKKLMSRVGIFDVPGGDLNNEYDAREQINTFREGIGMNDLDYGMAYFPWMHSSVVSEREITFVNFDLTLLQPLLDVDDEAAKAEVAAAMSAKLMEEDDTNDPPLFKKGDYKLTVKDDAGADTDVYEDEAGISRRDAALRIMVPSYKSVIVKEAIKVLNLMPPASAMAGIFTKTDNDRGVWKAPANVSMSGIVGPSYNVNNDLNDEMNMPLNGKAINPIRAFPGQGSIVWGARTLDGNSQDWRYINVRRTMIFLEMSVKAAARAYVFEPNDANTWVMVSAMISNFLNNVWKAGGLAGATPGDAYDVQVGLGKTMTANDILDGYMNIAVRVAVVRPAEFIVITFQQKMQES